MEESVNVMPNNAPVISRGVMLCDCEDWFNGMRNLDAIFVVAHQHGMQWMFKGFKFCPWCGKALEHKEILT